MRDYAAVITPLTSRVMGMVGALLCVSLLWAGPGVAHAQEPGVELAPTMVVLDASGVGTLLVLGLVVALVLRVRRRGVANCSSERISVLFCVASFW
jgi:hypothetical protein